MPAATVLRRLGPRRFFGYLRVTSIRDPFDRAVSEVFYTRRGRALAEAPLPRVRRRFEAWLAAGGAANANRRIFALGPVPVAQVFLRVEHLEDDLARLRTRLGVAFEPARLGRWKRPGSRPVPARACFTPRARALVERTHAREIARFGHAFEADGRNPGGGTE